MNEPVKDDAAERQWATDRFRDYLLGRLNEDDTERLTLAVAVYSGLIDLLEDVEYELLNAYLDGRLTADEKECIERQYVRTNDLDNRAKLQVQRALRSNEVQRAMQPPAPVPITRSRRPPGWTLAAASAALIIAGVLAGLYYVKSRELAEALAALKVKTTPHGPEREIPPEQPAGSSSAEGLILSARISGTGTAAVAKPPERLIWTPVPDYRGRYRFRIYSIGGQEKTSSQLAPKNNAIAYSVENSSSLALPWDVFVLSSSPAGERVLAHYIVRKSH